MRKFTDHYRIMSLENELEEVMDGNVPKPTESEKRTWTMALTQTSARTKDQSGMEGINSFKPFKAALLLGWIKARTSKKQSKVAQVAPMRIKKIFISLIPKLALK